MDHESLVRAVNALQSSQEILASEPQCTRSQVCPFQSTVLQIDPEEDILPAAYRNDNHITLAITNTEPAIAEFLRTDLSLTNIEPMLPYLSFNLLFYQKAKRDSVPPLQCIEHRIIVSGRMDHHLLCDYQNVWIKPLPRYMLDPNFWETHLACPAGCACQHRGRVLYVSPACKAGLRGVARGFLYTYACLIPDEYSLGTAQDKRLLPLGLNGTKVMWDDWKRLVKEILTAHHNPHNHRWVHPRFAYSLVYKSHLWQFSFVTCSAPWFTVKRNISDSAAFFTIIASVLAVLVLLLTTLQVGIAAAVENDEASKYWLSIGLDWASRGYHFCYLFFPALFFCYIIFHVHALLIVLWTKVKRRMGKR